ncbi:TonB-dependent receptor [Oceanicaulis sp. LC35]|uniref:TonB-dependent receptor n=1 Tax=Oceanicaulis sp. LC35 TaxID=3349635 RepID=UPI003F8621D0
MLDHSRKFRPVLQSGTALAVLLLASQTSVAVAQEATGESPQAVSTTDVIMVTARKREESLLDTPIAISAFSGEELSDMGALEIYDFIQQAPGVSMSSDGAFQQLAIRGIGTSLGGNANGYYLDNVPFTGVSVPWNPNVQPFDVNRVEVLRGPQGTLFGEGSMGGTIRIITNTPDTSTYEGRVELWGQATEGGSMSDGMRGMVNIPLVEDVIALRVVGIDEHRAGWVDTDGANNVNDIDVETYRARLRITPNDRLTIDVAGWFNDQETGATSSSTADGYASSLSSNHDSYDQYSFSAEYELDLFTIQYAYGTNEFLRSAAIDYGAQGTYAYSIGMDVDTHELVLNGDLGDNFVWTAGYYYRDAVRTDISDWPFAGIDTVGLTQSTAQSVFAEGEYQFNEQWRFAAGVRYFTEDLSVDEQGFGSSGPIDYQNDDTFDGVSPRFILTYQPTDYAMFYTSAARGFRGGQNQPAVSAQIAQMQGLDLPASLPSDSIWTYELGGKVELFDTRLTLEGAIYHSEWSDPAQRFQLTDSLNGLMAVEGIDVSGLEVSAIFDVTEYLTANASLSLVDAEYTSDIPGSNISAGDTPENVSDVTASASLNYFQPEFAWGYGLFGRLGVSYTSDRGNPAYDTFINGDALTMVDGRVGLEGDRYGIFVFADNITNEDGAISYINVGTGQASRYRPRSIGVELRGSF